MLRRIPDPAEDLHRTESDKIHQEIFPGYGICILNSYIQCHDPMSIDTLSKKVGVSKKISSFTIPLGATINMDGTSIMQGVGRTYLRHRLLVST